MKEKTKKIYLSVNKDETSMALVNDNVLLEYQCQRNHEDYLVGSIFKGRVQKVLPALQACFVSIGLDKNAYLFMQKNKKYTEGQSIIVQIKKEPSGNKGPAVTDELTIAGRYVVLVPDEDYVAISKQIEDEEVRKRLSALVGSVRPEKVAFIVRTAAETVSEEELKRDVEHLLRLWRMVLNKEKIINKPSVLYREYDLAVRVVRDYLLDDVQEVVIDESDTYKRVSELIAAVEPNNGIKVRQYRGKREIFSYFSLADKISSIVNRRVNLPGGGYLVFDNTEALTVIDVNSGGSVTNSTLSETILQTNLLAAKEIAIQLRLRDITGIIVVDFIDMQKEKDKSVLLEVLKASFQEDKKKPKVLGLTNLGLVEITRKKTRQNMLEMIYSDCPYCYGSGKVQAPETVCIEIKKRLRNYAGERVGDNNIIVQAHQQVIDCFNKHFLRVIARELGHKITSQVTEGMHPECFAIIYDE